MPILVIDDFKYKLWKPEDEEKEFHPIIKEHYKHIFGEDSIYFDMKHKLKSKPGSAAIPDAFVITLSKPYTWYIVENELADHPPYEHIVPQLTKFINNIEKLEIKNKIRDILYNELSNYNNKELIKRKTGQDSFQFLDNLVSDPPKICIIINEIKPGLEDAVKTLKAPSGIEIIEFKTFESSNAPNVRAYLITEPLYKLEEHENKNWESSLARANNNLKELVDILSKQIEELGDVKKEVSGKYLCFYKIQQGVRSIFTAFILTTGALKVRIRTNPNTFSDPQKLTGDKIYKGWFFKKIGQEREFKITSKESIPYAMELIRHSYEFSGKQEL